LVKTGAELTLLGAILGGRPGAVLGALVGGAVAAEGVERGGSVKFARIIAGAFPANDAAPSNGLDDEYFDAPPLPFYDINNTIFDPWFSVPCVPSAPATPSKAGRRSARSKGRRSFRARHAGGMAKRTAIRSPTLLLDAAPAPAAPAVSAPALVAPGIAGLYSTDLTLNEFLAHADRHGWFALSDKDFKSKTESYAVTNSLNASLLKLRARVAGSTAHRGKKKGAFRLRVEALAKEPEMTKELMIRETELVWKKGRKLKTYNPVKHKRAVYDVLREIAPNLLNRNE
jgi:hypothetical protein